MKHETCFWALLILGMLVALLFAMWVAPGWGMPVQNMERQTVPTRTPTPVLALKVYLPIVLRNFSGISP